MRACVLVVCAALGAAGCAPRAGLTGPVTTWEETTPAEQTKTTTPATPPEPTAAPKLATAPVVLFGAAVNDGACLADKSALSDVKAVQARLDDVAAAQGVALGAPRVVQLVRDPARSLTDPPPHACRPLVTAGAALKAPLVRDRQAAARWFVQHAVVDDALTDAARRVVEGAAAHGTALAPPRALIDDNGAIIGLALPVASSPLTSR
jgi:hypothetical protein